MCVENGGSTCLKLGVWGRGVGLFVNVRSSRSHGGAALSSENVQFLRQALKAAADGPAHHGRGEVKDHRVQTGVERAGDECQVSPLFAPVVHVAHHMGDVVGREADGKHQQGDHRQPHGPQTALTGNAGQLGQDSDEVDVAEAADEEGDEKEHQEEFKAHRYYNLQLVVFKVIVALPGFLDLRCNSAGNVSGHIVCVCHKGHNVSYA